MVLTRLPKIGQFHFGEKASLLAFTLLLPVFLQSEANSFLAPMPYLLNCNGIDVNLLILVQDEQ